MKIFLIATLVGLSVAQAQRDLTTTTTPVPILRQINKVNEDGSYTYGYENADGSYKIETKDVNGQVQGKYGYYDDQNQLREVEYGASKRGFYPTGTDIKAPEVAEHQDNPNAPQDGSYDPELYTYPYQYNYEGAPATNQIQSPTQGRRLRVKSGRRLQQQQFQQFQAQPQQQYQQQQPAPQPQAQPQYYQANQQPQQYYNQQAQAPAPQAPVFNPAQLFHGHPARNVNLNDGSYSINYSG